ncbi:MAG TPA: proline iminopeptidase-family hydrolase [Candidatus Nanoarchaeia archaeon]
MMSNEGLVKVKGGRIWYKISGKENDKPPLLLVHGGPGFPHNSLESLEILSKKRPLIFYDQLGCGKSDRPKNPRLWVVDRFIEEIETIRKSIRLQPFHLLGHSWGSLIAAEYATVKPKGLLSLVLSGPLLSVNKWVDDANKLKKKLSPTLQKAITKNENKGLVNTQDYKKAALEFYKRFYCRVYPFPKLVEETNKGANLEIYNTMWGPTEFTCTGNLRGYDVTDKLDKITVPVLLTCGRYDEAAPQTVRFFKSLFKNAEMVVFENSAHLPFIEEQKKYIKILNNFLVENE